MRAPRVRIAILAAVSTLATVSGALADDGPVVLLLSGGGARGAAHVGVLKVLEEEHVRVDAIVGTSMGALVGGLYAAGLPAAEIERAMVDADWLALFHDRPERALGSFRSKQDEREFLSRGSVRLDRLRPSLPLGALAGRRIRDLLREKTAGVAGIDDFSKLPIPFRAVATDLETGEAVELDHGDLVQAVRASMAVPGAFTPIEIGGRHLVDGGISENLAIQIAGRSGPARIIAVDISSPPLRYDELGSPAAVLLQAVTLLMDRESARQLERLDADDLLIRPELGAFSSTSFDRAAEAMRIGEAAARAAVDKIRRFAVSAEEYAAWRNAQQPRNQDAPLVREVVVNGPDLAAIRAARRRLEANVGSPLNDKALRQEAEGLRATGLFDAVDAVVVPDAEGGVRVRLDIQPRAHGGDSLLYGLRLLDDLAGGTAFDLGFRWVARDLRHTGLEARTDVRLGLRQAAIIDLFQPLGLERRLFVDTAAGFREEPFAVFLTEPSFVLLRRRDLFARLDLGTELGHWGELRVGVEHRKGSLRRSSEEGLAIAKLRFDETLTYARFGVDTFDEVTFPKRGALVRLEVDRVLGSDLGESGVTFGELLAQRAWTLSTNRFVAGIELGDNLSGDPFFPRLAAGGLFRLSGFAEDELRGSRLAIAHVRVSREIGGGAARNPVFFGGSVELGQVLSAEEGFNWDDARLAGSLYLAVDSVLGPAFVHLGLAEGGRRSWGFSLGHRIF